MVTITAPPAAMRLMWVTLGRWSVGQRNRRLGRRRAFARGPGRAARARPRRRAGRWGRAARRAETARARRGRCTRSPGAALGHLAEAAGTGVEDRGERMPRVADRVSAVENRQELVRRPQAVVITDAPCVPPRGTRGTGCRVDAAYLRGCRPRNAYQLALDQHLGDLDAVGRCALAQVVGDDPQRETVAGATRRDGCGRPTPDPGRRQSSGVG